MVDEAENIEDEMAATMDSSMSAVTSSDNNTDTLSIESIFDIQVEISVVLGKTTIPVSDLLEMSSGTVIELQRKIGEPVDVFINNRLVAKGEVVIVEDKIGITLTEILKLETKEQ